MSEAQVIRHATRVTLSIGSTTQTGEFQFSKVTIGLERDLAPMENPLDAYRDINALLQRALQDVKAPPVKPDFSGPEKAQPPAVATQNGLKQNDTSHSATPLEKAAESLRWGKSTNNPARQWTKIKDAEESPELKQVLTFVREHAVNGYATIGSHVYRVEGEGQFLGRYPKREVQPK
jgi:hypothetical protein